MSRCIWSGGHLMFNNDLPARIRAIYKQGSPNSKITERICINYF